MSTSTPSAQPSTIVVSGLAPATTEQSLDQFFSFCGKIQSITKEEKSATIKFETNAAAKTSLMLDGGTLDGSVIGVKPIDEGLEEFGSKEDHPSSPTTGPHQPGAAEEIKQEDKPRSAIAAEYLAHGYVLGDQAISKAIALDQKHGISSKFMSYFRKIQEKASKTCPPTIPEAPKQKLNNLKTLSAQHYEKALRSPSGTKVYKFYTDTSKQILDVHSEAKRIAENKLGHSIFASVQSPQAPTPPPTQATPATQAPPPAAPQAAPSA